MPDIITLNQNSDFRRAYKRGKSLTHPALVVYCVKNRAGVCRVGITTSKRLGTAVYRNRCRRVISEAFRNIYPRCKGGYDIVFVARYKTGRKKSTEVADIMKKLLAECGIIE